MTTYQTGNPIGSADPRDLYDNAQVIDDYANSEQPTTTDRLGVERATIAGIDAAARNAIANAGYEFVGDYAPGIELTAYNQVVRDTSGEFWRVSGSTALPYTTTGAGLPEGGAFVTVGDAALRQELAGSVGDGQGGLLVRGSVIYVDTIADLQALDTSGLVDGQRVSVDDSGEYRWSAAAGEFVKASVSSDDDNKGAQLVGYGQRTVKGALDSLLDRRNSIIPPSLPAVTNSPKLVMTVDGVTFVVTRKANGRQGYVAMSIGDAVAPADAQNAGGASNLRLQETIHIGRAYVAKTGPLNKSSGVVLTSLDQTTRDRFWGYSGIGAGADYYSAAGGSALEVNWSNRAVYEIPAGGSISYTLSGQKATVRFGTTAGSSTDVRVEVSRDNSSWSTAHTLNLSLSSSGVGKRDVEVTSPSPVGETWYLRVRNNAGSGLVYVPGVNVAQLDEAVLDRSIDNALFQRLPSIDGAINAWLSGSGANEFAARSTDGKFYGTYHGGHSGFLQRLRTTNASYNLDTGEPPTLLLTSNVHLFSASTLTVGATKYLYTAMTQFGDGVAITSYNVELDSEAPAEFDAVYTHMSTTSRNFDYVHSPVFFRKIDDGDVDIGKGGFIQQYLSSNGMTLNTYFSQVDLTNNSRNGAYIRFVDAYNKQYYGPILSNESVPFWGGSYVTAKEFF